MIDNLKTYFAELLLKRSKTENRKVIAKNMSDITRVFLVYELIDEEVHNGVKNYIKELKEVYGIKEVFALGYVNKREIKSFVKPTKEMQYIGNKNIGWYKKPKESFDRSNFDVLINLCATPCLPISYVVAQSNIPFKIASFSEENQNLHDMMIDCGEEFNLKKFIKEINHYLNILNKKHAA